MNDREKAFTAIVLAGASVVVIVVAACVASYMKRNGPPDVPPEVESATFPIAMGRIELGCADHSKDVKACLELNAAALPQASRLWANATREQRLACYDRRIGLVNQSLRIRECLVARGVPNG